MPKHLRIKARRQCYKLAGKALKLPLLFAEPLAGVAEPEINYYGFTLINGLSNPPIHALHLAPTVANIALPVVWNYLDGACALAVGLNQLLDEDNYRQTQMKVKGLLNIFSGVQLFLLSYNPLLVSSLGITGAPAALAGTSFAIAMLVDVITAAIDFVNAWKEKNINGWLEERYKEYIFLQKRIATLQQEDAIVGDNWNQAKIDALKSRKDKLEENIALRYRVHYAEVSPKVRGLLQGIIDTSAEKAKGASEEDIVNDANIQAQCQQQYTAAGNTLFVKVVSAIGMGILAAGFIALFIAVPNPVPITGLAITAVVAAIYFYRHQQEIRHKVAEVKNSLLSFFAAKPAKEEPEASPLLTENANKKEKPEEVRQLQQART